MDDSIVFIKLTDDMKRDINGFTVDPAVPLPVEKLPGKADYDPIEASEKVVHRPVYPPLFRLLCAQDSGL